jgi:hypothetical protein
LNFSSTKNNPVFSAVRELCDDKIPREDRKLDGKKDLGVYGNILGQDAIFAILSRDLKKLALFKKTSRFVHLQANKYKIGVAPFPIKKPNVFHPKISF